MKNKGPLVLSLLTTLLCSCASPSEVDAAESGETPEESSTTSIDPYAGLFQICEGVYASHAPGIYEESFNLVITVEEGYTFKYTDQYGFTDETDYLPYTAPIPIALYYDDNLESYPFTTAVDGILDGNTTNKCYSPAYNVNVQTNGDYYLTYIQPSLGIVVYNPNNEKICDRTLSYFIKEETIGEDPSLPIISLNLKYEDMFGTNGFYNAIWQDIEKRANLEFIDPEYDEYFFRNTQIKLGGNWSQGYPQRTLNLNFNKDENGDKNAPVTNHVFGDRSTRADPNKELTGITRFRLHNSGNCFELYTGFNDALLQSIMADSYASTSGWRPALTYINGEYWGLYYIREHYKNNYFATNYGVDKDDVAIYEMAGGWKFADGEDEAAATMSFQAMLSYISQGLSSDSVYNAFITQYIDIDSFMDVVIANAYACNWDFLGNYNNLKVWSVTKKDPNNPYADGRWRFAIHDADFAFTESTNMMSPDYQYSYSINDILGALLKNQTFKDELYARAEELCSTSLSSSNAIATFDEMIDMVRPYKLEAAYRWGQGGDYADYWQGQLTSTYYFLEHRAQIFLSQLRESLDRYA